ncbi:unnamed protein product [Vicia faba]|uniref:Uncharacterized protein n=1 Tax=Vicia faba TaxID=3906 RepID=A0AAV1A5K0_VICFA|nr:unnamed protein product [Vicia faba]
MDLCLWGWGSEIEVQESSRASNAITTGKHVFCLKINLLRASKIFHIISHDSEASSRNQASRNSDSTRLSLTHFLDRKLHNSSTVPQTVPGKLTPFQSPASEQDGSVKLTEEERKSATADEKLILGMFKQEGKCDFVPPLDLDELGNSVAGDGQGARKRKNPFEAEVYLAG